MVSSPISTQGNDAAAALWDAAADGWDAQTPWLRSWLAGPTDAMLDMANVQPGMHVLDIAAGAGDQSCDIARRVGPLGTVLATDVSPRMLATAALNLSAAGLDNVQTRVADVAALDLDGANFDAAACRLGMMLLADPLLGLRTVHRALRPGGRFCAMVFSEPRENPCIGILVSIVRRHAGLPSSDLYQPGSLLSLGQPGLIEELFWSAGFVDVEVRRVNAPFKLPSIDDYLRFIRTAAGPIMAILDRMDGDAQQAAWAEITDALSRFTRADGWEAPTELLIAAGAR